MSLRLEPSSKQTNLLRALESSDVSLTSKVSTESKIQSYVLALKQNEEQIPKVKYSPWINFRISNICKAATCCFHSRCCTTEIQYLVAQPTKSGVVFHSLRSEDGPASDVNIMTNATFFSDLYTKHGEYLPYLMASAIAYLPTKELKQFWKSWDPKSTEPLDLSKAMMFKEILNQAHQVYDEVRLEMMKQDMLNMFKSSHVRSLHRTLDRVTGSSARERCITPQRSSPSFKTVTQTEEPEPDILPMPRVKVEGLADRMEHMTLTEGRKFVFTGHDQSEFDEERMIKNITKMTKCSRKKAEEVTREVQEAMPSPCTTEELWDILKEIIHQKQLRIECSMKDPFSREILELAIKSEALTVRDIPVEDFAQILRMKKKIKGKKPQEQKEVEREIQEKKVPEVSLKQEDEKVSFPQLSVTLV